MQVDDPQWMFKTNLSKDEQGKRERIPKYRNPLMEYIQHLKYVASR